MNGAEADVPNDVPAVPINDDVKAVTVDAKSDVQPAKDNEISNANNDIRPEHTVNNASDPEAQVEDKNNGEAEDEVVFGYAKRKIMKRPRLNTFCTFYGILLFILPLVFLAIIAFLLRRPVTVLIIASVSLIPAFICFLLIKFYLHDDVVPTSFLMDQIFIGAVPGVVISVLAIILVLAIIVRYTFSESIFSQFFLIFRQISTLASTTGNLRQIHLDRYRHTDVYKIVVYGPLVIGAVASVIQEFAKLSVAFRCEQLLHFGPALGPRGALATAAAAGLGFATSQIVGWSLIIAGQGISFLKVGAILLMSLWMLPFHICTSFLMGVAIAKKKILHARASVFGAYLTAVIFSFLMITGNLYLTGILFYRAFLLSKGFSGWIFAGGIIGKLVIIVALIVLCKRSFKTMDLERYHGMPGFEIEDADAEPCEV